MAVRSSGSSPCINVAVIGPHQHGKSTLAGFLLYALHQIPTALMNEADQAASNRRDPSRKFAFLLDRKAHERIIIANECRGTQETSWWGLERKGQRYMLINSPGWHSRITSLIGVLSDADAVLFVVDTETYLENLRQEEAAQGDQKQTIPDTLTQVYTHLSLVRFYGVQQLIVALHKMDKIDFSERTYQEAKTHLERVIEKLGWNKSQVRFVPTAVTATEEKGYNIIEPDPVFSEWSQHPSLLRAIEQLHPQSLSTHAHFRMQLNSIHQGRRVPIPGFQLVTTGKVIAGTVQVDDELLIQPSGTRCKVHSIQAIDNSKYFGPTKPWFQQSRAITGEPVTLLCTIIEGEVKVNRGEIAGTATSSPRVSQRLRAELTSLASPPFSDLFVKNLSGIFVMGYFLTGFRIDDFSLDRGKTWQRNGHKSRLQKRALLLDIITNPHNVSPILGELRLAKQTPLETYAENSYLGRFVLLGSNSFPIFGGHIIEVL